MDLLTTFCAAACTLGVHVGSVHFSPGYENANVGAYLKAPNGLTVGVVRNSYGRTSTYLAKTWETADRRFALTAGAITGYPAADVAPLLVPSVRFDVAPGWSARISYLPKPPKYGSSDAVHLSVETTLGGR